MPDEVRKGSAAAPPKAAGKASQAQALRRQLEDEEARLKAELAPHRELYERHVNDPAYVKARREIKRISGELGPIQNELAALARSGGSRGVRAEPGVYQGEE